MFDTTRNNLTARRLAIVLGLVMVGSWIASVRAQDPPPAPRLRGGNPPANRGNALTPPPAQNNIVRPNQPQVLSVSTRLNTAPELVLETGGFMTEVGELAFSPDGRLLAVTGDKVARIFDTQTGTQVRVLRGDHSRSAYGSTSGIAFSPDGQFLLVGVYDYFPGGSIRVYRTDNLDEILQLLPGMNAPCGHLTFSRDGKYLAGSDSDGEIVIWDWPARRVLKRIPPRNPDKPIIDCLKFADAEPYLVSVEFDSPHIYRVPDGVEVNTSSYIPPRILGWMADVLQKQVQWPAGTNVDPRQYEFVLDKGYWGAAGSSVEAGRTSYWLGLFRAREMNASNRALPPFAVYKGHRWKVSSLAISSNGLVASGDKFGEVHIWEARTGAPRHRILSEGQPIYQVGFDGSNQRIVYGHDPDLANWGFNSYGRPSQVFQLLERAIQAAPRQGLRVQNEATQIGQLSIRAVPPATGEQSYRLQKLQGGRAVSEYRIPSGRTLAVFTLLPGPQLGVQEPVLFADAEGLLAMWDTSRSEMRRFYRGHSSMVTSICPSANGTLFVTGSTDRTIRIWSLLDHKATGIFDFKYENSAVIEVPPNSSSARAGVQVGDRIVNIGGLSLNDVYELMLYNRFDFPPGRTLPVTLRRGDREFTYNMTLDEGFDYVEPLLNIFIAGPGRWIMWTPQGYYDCSPGADDLIGWHVNNGRDKAASFFRVQQFRNQLYRPDIINRVIETGVVTQSIADANARLPNLPPAVDLTSRESFDARQPPVVAIQNPANGGNFDDPRVNIDATITALNDLPITAVTLLHNGTPAKVFKPANQNELKSLAVSHRVRLFPGRNELTFIAANAASTSNPDDARLTLFAPAGESKSRAFILSIGISDYANAGKGFDGLKYAADDARAFAQACIDHNDGKIYSEVQTKVFTNQEATRENILGGLQWLVDNVQQGDVVMLFASAHGFLDDRENFYLSTHEVDLERLRATGISWREITGTLQEDLPACKRVVLLDSCHSAGIATSDVRNPLQDLAAPEMGTIFYASCTLQQKSFEQDEWRHGAFTKAILDMLGDPKSDVSPSTGDGLVSALELDLSVTDRVRAMTGDRQNPVVYAPPDLKRLNILEFR